MIKLMKFNFYKNLLSGITQLRIILYLYVMILKNLEIQNTI